MSAWTNLAWAPGAWSTGAWQPASAPPPTPSGGFLPPVYSVLTGSAAIRAIVGSTPSRIYRHGRAPQFVGAQPRDPYITWFLVGGVPELNLSDSPPFDRMAVQVDCWHPDDTGVETLAKLVRDRIEVFTHVTGIVINERDTETRLYRIGLQADWFWGRP